MKPLAATALAVLLAACTTDLLGSPVAGDGGTGDDLGHAQSCGDLSAAVGEWLGEHLACKTDADCTTLTTACGLVGMCGTIANTSATGPTLAALVDAWNKMMCGQPCACPAHPPQPPGCNHGVCGAKMYGTAPLGASCAWGDDCATGDCFTGWKNGYCTVEGCLAKGGLCPMGGICRDVGLNNAGLCLKPCDVHGTDCRTGDGYMCCNSSTAPMAATCVGSSACQ